MTFLLQVKAKVALTFTLQVTSFLLVLKIQKNQSKNKNSLSSETPSRKLHPSKIANPEQSKGALEIILLFKFANRAHENHVCCKI